MRYLDWHELIGDSPPRLSTEIQRAAYAILWMGLRGEREGLPSMLATSFAEAAGVSGRQKWGLMLSSSARVSQVTYQTVVGVLWWPKEAKPDSGLICGPKTETTNCERGIGPARAGSGMLSGTGLWTRVVPAIKEPCHFHFPRFWSLLSGTLVRQVEWLESEARRGEEGSPRGEERGEECSPQTCPFAEGQPCSLHL